MIGIDRKGSFVKFDSLLRHNFIFTIPHFCKKISELIQITQVQKILMKRFVGINKRLFFLLFGEAREELSEVVTPENVFCGKNEADDKYKCNKCFQKDGAFEKTLSLVTKFVVNRYDNATH